MDADFREWQPDTWFDEGFLELIPAPARREVLEAVRPLAACFHDHVHESLFAGIKQPFHFLHATGWMRRLQRSDCPLPDSASFGQRESCMRNKVPWPLEDAVFLVYHQPTTYAMRWGTFLRYFRKGWMNLDTMLVCHPRARETILYWEERGPVFGKRGSRVLRTPTLNDEVVRETSSASQVESHAD